MKALRKRAGNDVWYRAGVEKSVHFFPVRLQQRKLMTIGGLHCRGASGSMVRTGAADLVRRASSFCNSPRA